MMDKFYLTIWGKIRDIFPNFHNHSTDCGVFKCLLLSPPYLRFSASEGALIVKHLCPRRATGCQAAIVRIILIMTELRTPGRAHGGSLREMGQERVPFRNLLTLSCTFPSEHLTKLWLFPCLFSTMRTMLVLFNSMFPGPAKQKGFKKCLLNEQIQSCPIRDQNMDSRYFRETVCDKLWTSSLSQKAPNLNVRSPSPTTL